MKEIIDKISSYNIFNYLLPGIVFIVLLQELTEYRIVKAENVITDAFTVYFIGLIVSRFGSLIIEPLLKYTGFVKFSDYKKFVSACPKDPKIELFVEIANQYRTLFSMLVLLLLARFYHFVEMKWNISSDATKYLWLSCLLILFLFSYRKQTSYVSKRVDAQS